MIKNRREGGQSLVIIAIAFLGLVAVAALIIDGGSLYLNRRTAQTAADAAAMAGAHEKCVNKGDLSAVQTVATQFATENHATTVESVTIDADGAVVVQTMVETSSFFARVLGYENNTVRAIASAACFAPGSVQKLLPIAWACQPPVGMVGGLDPDTCVIHSIPIDMFETLYTLYNMGNTGSVVLDDGYVGNPTSYNDGVDNDGFAAKMAYIVMDSSNDPDEYCQAPLGIGTINCDLNNDGTPDVNFGSSRGWLGLDGNMSDSSIINNMTNGYSGKLTLPMWFPGSQGAKANGFDAITIGKPMLIPVFNFLCPDTTGPGLATNPAENPLCTGMFQSGDTYVDAGGASTHPYFRVPGFAQFVVTCIVKQGPNNKFCPARTYAGIPYTGQWNSVNSIEGYFITGSVPGTSIDPDGFDLGVYIISLTK